MPENDANNVGQDKQYADYTDKYDAEHGKYVDTPPEDTPEASKFATGNMPKAPDPNPFNLGAQAPGDRGGNAAE